MSAIGKIIRELREERGWSQSDLAIKAGLKQTTVSTRESGKFRVKPPERKLFADAFDMDLEDFDALWRAAKIDQTNGGNGIPIINRAPAGNIVDYEEFGVDSGQGFQYIDFGGLPENEMLFAVIVVGDSMTPGIKDGDKLIFKPLDRERPSAFEDGQVAFIRFAEEYKERGCTIARVSRTESGQLLLAKDNHKYKHRLVDREMISQIAVAVERRTESI